MLFLLEANRTPHLTVQFDDFEHQAMSKLGKDKVLNQACQVGAARTS